MVVQSKKVVIIGAGGHGKEVAEILQRQSHYENNPKIIGFVDDDPNLKGKRIVNLPVLDDWRWFDGVDRSDIAVVCAVGNPKVCKILVEKARNLNLTFVNAISPQAVISPSAKLGRGVIVFPNVVIGTDVIVSDFCTINVSVTVSHDSSVAKFTNLNPAATLAGNVNTGEGSFIGMGAKVIQGISIGSWAVVGAGAVVIRDVLAGTTVVGVPARQVEYKNTNQ